jgi:hypothetical protein
MREHSFPGMVGERRRRPVRTVRRRQGIAVRGRFLKGGVQRALVAGRPA